jgi:hypothetical protein
MLSRLCLIGVLLGAVLPAAADDVPPGLSSENPLSAIDPASLTGFRERPLFSPSRTRPPDPVAEPDPQVEAPNEQTPPTLNIELLGVIGSPDGTSALILDRDDETRHTVRVGETYQGWTVTEANGSQLVLGKDDEVIRLPVFKPSEGAVDAVPDEAQPSTMGEGGSDVPE